MEVISVIAWPFVALVVDFSVLLVVYLFREGIARALAERPMKLAFSLGKIRAVAETKDSNRMKEVRAALQSEAHERTLDADRLILRDHNGNARMLVTLMGDGTLLWGMFGEDQRPGALIAVEPNGKPGIELYDGERIRAQLRLIEGGNEALIFFDSNERMRSIIGLDAEGKSVVGLWDENGIAAWGTRA
jgi:hypothetical protein